MSSDTNPGDRTPLDCLRQELEAARALLVLQQALEAALRSGAGTDKLTPLLASYRAAVAAAESASRDRGRWFSGRGSLESWLTRERPPDAAPLRHLAAEAATLRSELERGGRRLSYLAKRTVEWTEAQTAALVDWVMGAGSGGATYGSPEAKPSPKSGAPCLLDQQA